MVGNLSFTYVNKWTEWMKNCWTFQENEIVNKEKKWLFCIILTPKGN